MKYHYHFCAVVFGATNNTYVDGIYFSYTPVTFDNFQAARDYINDKFPTPVDDSTILSFTQIGVTDTGPEPEEG